jgi:hypothetical protein
VTKDDTLILRGKGTQEDIEKRIAQIQDELEASTSDYEKVISPRKNLSEKPYNQKPLRWSILKP